MQTFNEVQKLLSKTNGKVVGDLMTPAPVVVRETTNLEDAARFCSLDTYSSQFSSIYQCARKITFFPHTSDYYSRRNIADFQL